MKGKADGKGRRKGRGVVTEDKKRDRKGGVLFILYYLVLRSVVN